MFDGLLFDFTNKHNLTYIDLYVPESVATEVNVKGCHHLVYLRVNAVIQLLHLKNLSDCRNLRVLHIHSGNADLIKQVQESFLPPACVVYWYKDVPPAEPDAKPEPADPVPTDSGISDENVQPTVRVGGGNDQREGGFTS